MAKAVIFDMDGVITDTQKYHAQVESEILARYNIDISPEKLTARYSGVRSRDLFKMILCKQDRPFDAEELVKEKYSTLMGIGKIDPIPGSVELIVSLYREKIPIAVGSASTKIFIDHILTKLDVYQYFSAIVSTEMVKNGKPDPETFLLAAKYLDVLPKDCVVIEDGVAGMAGARDGGMKCIGLVSDLRGKYPTNNLVTSLKDVDVDYIKNL